RRLIRNPVGSVSMNIGIEGEDVSDVNIPGVNNGTTGIGSGRPLFDVPACTLSWDEFVQKDVDTNILKKSRNSNLDTSITTECSSLQKRPCAQLQSPLNTSITDSCTQEGASSLTPIEGAVRLEQLAPSESSKQAPSSCQDGESMMTSNDDIMM
ncbi:hypothetical protein Tco_0339505, partial [Tanacetum coccineum]